MYIYVFVCTIVCMPVFSYIHIRPHSHIFVYLYIGSPAEFSTIISPNKIRRSSLIFSHEDTPPSSSKYETDGANSNENNLKNRINIERTFSDPQKSMNSNIKNTENDPNGVDFENKNVPPEDQLVALVRYVFLNMRHNADIYLCFICIYMSIFYVCV
jgi:hypothetical protein